MWLSGSPFIPPSPSVGAVVAAACVVAAAEGGGEASAVVVAWLAAGGGGFAEAAEVPAVVVASRAEAREVDRAAEDSPKAQRSVALGQVHSPASEAGE